MDYITYDRLLKLSKQLNTNPPKEVKQISDYLDGLECYSSEVNYCIFNNGYLIIKIIPTYSFNIITYNTKCILSDSILEYLIQSNVKIKLDINKPIRTVKINLPRHDMNICKYLNTFKDNQWIVSEEK